MFYGFDFDASMLRVASMNMMLHGIEKLTLKQENEAEWRSTLTFLEQEEELTNLQEQRNVQAKKMAETEANIESLKKEQRQYLAEFDKNIMQELTESREKLASYQQELIKYEEALKRTIVKPLFLFGFLIM